MKRTGKNDYNELAEKIDINTVSRAKLKEINEIGEQSIDYRKAHDDFTSIDGVKNVEELGFGIMKKIKLHITF